MARIKTLDQVLLIDMIKYPNIYSDFPNIYIDFPYSELLTIGKKILTVPDDLDKFSNAICYGQRLYLGRKEENDFGFILRFISGYFYPAYSNQKWDEEKLLSFVKKVVTCKAIKVYPIAMHLIKLMGQLADREKSLLHREPTKIELAAGIEKLNIFAELNSLDFLRDAMKITVAEVLLTPYSECLVRFMNAKEIADFQLRYFDLMKAENEPKNKFQKK